MCNTFYSPINCKLSPINYKLFPINCKLLLTLAPVAAHEDEAGLTLTSEGSGLVDADVLAVAVVVAALVHVDARPPVIGKLLRDTKQQRDVIR